MDALSRMARLRVMRKSLIATMCIAVMAATGLAACSSGPQSATNEKFITKDPATVVETGVKLPEQRDLEFKLDGSVSKAKVEIADAEIAEQVKGSKNLRIHPKKVGETTIKLTDPNGKEYQIPLRSLVQHLIQSQVHRLQHPHQLDVPWLRYDQRYV